MPDPPTPGLQEAKAVILARDRLGEDVTWLKWEQSSYGPGLATINLAYFRQPTSVLCLVDLDQLV